MPRHHCQRCGACCRIAGFVRLRQDEIAKIAEHLGLNVNHFIQHYTRLAPQRRALALIDKPSGECFFLEGNDCALQDAKPEQCKSFPEKWNYPGWREICRAASPEKGTKGTQGT